MTCQDECPETQNAVTNADKSHGNVVWKGKQQNEDSNGQRVSKTEDRDKVISRHQREEQSNKTTNNRKNGQSAVNAVGSERAKTRLGDKIQEHNGPSLEIGEVIVKKIETKPNKDIGARINDPTENVTEVETKARENIEIGLSVINITKGGREEDDEDSGENQNTDIGTPILKLGEKTKEKLGKKLQMFNNDTLRGSQKGQSQVKFVLDKDVDGQQSEEKGKDPESGTHSNADLGGNILTLKTEKTTRKDKSFNNLKVINSNGSFETKRKALGEDNFKMFHSPNNKYKPQEKTNQATQRTKVEATTTPKSVSEAPAPCAGEICGNIQSIAEDIKEILTQKLPNLIMLNPTQQTLTSKKPVCKATGSTCKHPGQCCSQCCAVSDGVFRCFDQGTDECQSSLPGAIAPKCKKPGESCETQSECCLNKCTDCGRISKCDNEHDNICRLEGKQSASNTKLCKHLGDTCGEASECCTQCCAVSDGAFKCFEEGTHECQPGDNVSNTTIAETVEVIGFANK